MGQAYKLIGLVAAPDFPVIITGQTGAGKELVARAICVLQEQAFERVGGNETICTDVRLIAATHRDPKAWSAEGKLRRDRPVRCSRSGFRLSFKAVDARHW
jgi:DNA-binding NtrC family response regulator